MGCFEYFLIFHYKIFLAMDLILLCHLVLRPMTLPKAFVGMENCGCLCSACAATISRRYGLSWVCCSLLRLLALSLSESESDGRDSRGGADAAEGVDATSVGPRCGGAGNVECWSILPGADIVVWDLGRACSELGTAAWA